MRLSKIKSTADGASDAQKIMTKHSIWRLGALAGAIALLSNLCAQPAYALGLGRISVQSALGEALRAEIDVPEISAEEAASLRVTVAAPAAFKTAGLEYTPAVAGVQINLQKRADGRSFLSLTSTRPVTDPFVDLILEANWASGRLVRDYTMLFDPPSLRQAASSAPVAPTAPVLSRANPAPPPATTLRPQAAPAAQATARPTAPAPAPKEAPVAAIPKQTASGQQVTVKAGDTAGKIATQNKPAGISLDQMLVALLKSNPDAFVGGNINRLKSGAVLDVPTADDAGAVSPAGASRTIIAQSKDFNDFRQKLASGVPSAQVESAGRQSGGKVQAKVEDRSATAAVPDKLTLSKGALQGKAGAEDRIAKDKQAKDASTRVAELSKNIGDLDKMAGKVSAAPAPAPAAPAAPAVSAAVTKIPALAVPAAAALPASSALAAALPAAATKTTVTAAAPSPVASAASTTAVASTSITASATATVTAAPMVVASAPVASAPGAVKKPVVIAPPPPETGLIDQLTENPLVLPGLGALLALLAGFGFYRYKKRDNSAGVDSSFLESRLQPDSFFGASGGQRIDTSDAGAATGSSMVYSPSQLDAAGDVDPVAEADVYLAYGRDLQAEEILKEAVRINPSRVAIHAKLAEIYAKRRDAKAFEVVASEAHALTRGNGPEWAFICELGRDLEPGNATYQPGGEPQAPKSSVAAVTPAIAAGFGGDTVPQMIATASSASDSDVDFDLDLDFSADDAPSLKTQPFAQPLIQLAVPAAPVHEPTVATRMVASDSVFDSLDMDFGTDVKAVAATNDALSFNVDSLPSISNPSHKSSSNSSSLTASPPAAAALDSGMLEFDMGSLSLDLDSPSVQSPAASKTAVSAAPAAVSGPLETKFALAEEFRALGDADGARSLASEVVAQAQGSLKTKAQAFLNALS